MALNYYTLIFEIFFYELVHYLHLALNQSNNSENNFHSSVLETFASWAIDPWPLRVKGLIVLVSAN